MKTNLKKIGDRGVALVEIIIGSAIILSGILAISSTYAIYVQYALANQRNVQATYILSEGLEVMGFLRDGNYNNIFSLDVGTDHYLYWDGSDWSATTTPQYVDGRFERKINLAQVFRDADDRISASGIYDPDTLFVNVTVSYFQGHGTTTKSIGEYLTNLNND